MFSESQTLLDTTTYFQSSLYNFKVGLAVLSALQNWDGTVRAPLLPVAVFSKHCVCAQLVKEELSRSAVLAATFELGMPKQLPIHWPIFHKDSTHHLCSGLLGCCLSISGPESKHWLLWRSLCCFASRPCKELAPRRPKPVCSEKSCQLLANGSSTEHRTLTKVISTLQITYLVKWIVFGNTPSTYISKAFLQRQGE